MAMTQTQLVQHLAEQTELPKNDVKTVLGALEETILSEIGQAEKFKFAGLFQLEVKLKDATKEREGRNPATGEPMTISAKPASVQLKARPLAKAKGALPSVDAAKKKLG